jgi:hypothetical protein
MAQSQVQDEPTDLTELKAFVDLRDRVNKAIKEINMLRKGNATLSAQVKELEASGGGDGFSLGGDGETPEQLKAKIQDFIATINDVLGEPVEAA